MQVHVWKTVDVECEVEVSLNDILVEWDERMQYAERADSKRDYLRLLDSLTKLLARIPKEVFDGLTNDQWAIVRPRIENLLAAHQPELG